MNEDAKEQDDKGAPLEPCRAPELLATPVKLGSHNAGAARKAGCEDEYDNAIKARYGEGW